MAISSFVLYVSLPLEARLESICFSLYRYQKSLHSLSAIVRAFSSPTSVITKLLIEGRRDEVS